MHHAHNSPRPSCNHKPLAPVDWMVALQHHITGAAAGVLPHHSQRPLVNFQGMACLPETGTALEQQLIAKVALSGMTTLNQMVQPPPCCPGLVS
jgi:hypothetical protein